MLPPTAMRIGFAALAASVAVGALGTGTARADDEAIYLSDLQTNGFTNRNGGAAQIAQGRGVCSRLRAGETQASIAEDMFTQTHGATDLNSAYLWVNITIRDLCPDVAGPVAPPSLTVTVPPTVPGGPSITMTVPGQTG
jgi:hypothetical protein